MTARSQLETYLDGARRRLQWILSARGVVLLLGGLLLITLLAAWLLWRFAFNDTAVWTGRALLLLVLAGTVLWFGLRWRALRGAAGAGTLDRALPGQDGRVATYLEESAKSDGASPLISLLAMDALEVSRRESLARLIPARRIWVPALGALAVAGLFVALFLSNNPFADGARNLWSGRLPQAAKIAAAAGGIAVKPGDTTMRRNQDLAISAQVLGGGADVQMHVRFAGSDDWEIAPMDRGANGGYKFTLYAVRDDAQYYVTAGHLKSKAHQIKVVDLPAIRKLSLTYNYPSWTGLPQRVQDGGTDIRAVAGTQVGLEVVTSEPLQGPLLVIDGNGKPLSQSGATSRGKLAVNKDGHYRIATRFLGEVVALTPDYAIQVAPDEKPDVKVVRPGKDYRATSIEEVPVKVQAHDDYRLEALELHYSVNGGEWHSDKLPAGTADIQDAALLRMEEMKQPGPNGEAPLLTPGDLVSYYALARDHTHSVQTDLFLIQIQPFDQRYTQSQAGGGGGGGGGGEGGANISRRQKEVLLATWNLQRNQQGANDREKERNADNARMLSDVQATLAQQANTLVQRAQARELTGQGDIVNEFIKNMEEAAKAMDPAAKSLSNMKLSDAVTHEQKALQLLLRAESTFRDIQVAMRNQRGGGGGGGQQAGRDVSEMTELELDLAKNQYETEQQVDQRGGGGDNQQQDELMRRLEELARRQEQMARDSARQQQLTEAQKWQQEQLRREAEQLRQQLQQLAQRQNPQGGSPSQQSGSQSGSQSSSSSQSAAAQAAQQVAQALQQMQQGGSQNQQRASEQLQRAREQLERAQAQADSQRFAGLAQDAQDLAQRQRDTQQQLRSAIENNRQSGRDADPRRRLSAGLTYDQMDQMAAERRQLEQDLANLQQRMDNTRRQNAGQNPKASGQVAQARQELRDMDTTGALERSAYDIERGRGVQAATNDPVISDTLQRLQQRLANAADIASAESGARQQDRKADAADLLAELGNLRRALDRAREQALAQNQSGNGDPGAQSPQAREGQRGQAGGQSGQQGQGGQGQRGQQGQGANPQQLAQAGGQNGNAPGGSGNLRAPGTGTRNAGGGSRLGGGRLIGGQVPLNASQRELLNTQTQLSAERLAQIRQQLANNVISAADRQALLDLEKRLRRGNVDPMSAAYRNMSDLVSQLELSALKAEQLADKGQKKPTRVDETVDDSRRYRDNVAEYYRRLGGGND